MVICPANITNCNIRRTNIWSDGQISDLTDKFVRHGMLIYQGFWICLKIWRTNLSVRFLRVWWSILVISLMIDFSHNITYRNIKRVIVCYWYLRYNRCWNKKKTDDQIVICCEYKHQINNFGFTTQPTNGNYNQQREVCERRNAAVYLILTL